MTVIALNLAPQAMGSFARRVYPGALVAQAAQALTTGSWPAGALAPLVGVLMLAFLLLLLGWQGLERQEI